MKLQTKAKQTVSILLCTGMLVSGLTSYASAVEGGGFTGGGGGGRIEGSADVGSDLAGGSFSGGGGGGRLESPAIELSLSDEIALNILAYGAELADIVWDLDPSDFGSQGIPTKSQIILVLDVFEASADEYYDLGVALASANDTKRDIIETFMRHSKGYAAQFATYQKLCYQKGVAHQNSNNPIPTEELQALEDTFVDGMNEFAAMCRDTAKDPIFNFPLDLDGKEKTALNDLASSFESLAKQAPTAEQWYRLGRYTNVPNVQIETAPQAQGKTVYLNGYGSSAWENWPNFETKLATDAHLRISNISAYSDEPILAATPPEMLASQGPTPLKHYVATEKAVITLDTPQQWDGFSTLFYAARYISLYSTGLM